MEIIREFKEDQRVTNNLKTEILAYWVTILKESKNGDQENFQESNLRSGQMSKNLLILKLVI